MTHPSGIPEPDAVWTDERSDEGAESRREDGVRQGSGPPERSEGNAAHAHPITRYGDPVLHTRCAEVTAFDGDLATLVADLFASMYAADGVGLAANQIGVGLRVFVYDVPDPDGGANRVGHVVNPVLAAPKGRRHRDIDSEGCLSVPGQYADLARADLATVTGVDRHGAPLTVRGTGLLARCFQHEVDHLDGIVYVDRLSPRQRAAVLSRVALAPDPG